MNRDVGVTPSTHANSFVSSVDYRLPSKTINTLCAAAVAHRGNIQKKEENSFYVLSPPSLTRFSLRFSDKKKEIESSGSHNAVRTRSKWLTGLDIRISV